MDRLARNERQLLSGGLLSPRLDRRQDRRRDGFMSDGTEMNLVSAEELVALVGRRGEKCLFRIGEAGFPLEA